MKLIINFFCEVNYYVLNESLAALVVIYVHTALLGRVLCVQTVVKSLRKQWTLLATSHNLILTTSVVLMLNMNLALLFAFVLLVPIKVCSVTVFFCFRFWSQFLCLFWQLATEGIKLPLGCPCICMKFEWNEQSVAELLIILWIFAHVMLCYFLDHWPFNLELLQHLRCRVFKLWTEFEQNRIFRDWVIDDLNFTPNRVQGQFWFWPEVNFNNSATSAVLCRFIVPNFMAVCQWVVELLTT